MWTCPCEGKGAKGGTLLGRGEARLEAMIDLACKLCAHIEECFSESVHQRHREQIPERETSQADISSTSGARASERVLRLKHLSEALGKARAGAEHDRRDWDSYLWSTTRGSLGQPRVHPLVTKGFV